MQLPTSGIAITRGTRYFAEGPEDPGSHNHMVLCPVCGENEVRKEAAMCKSCSTEAQKARNKQRAWVKRQMARYMEGEPIKLRGDVGDILDAFAAVAGAPDYQRYKKRSNGHGSAPQN